MLWRRRWHPTPVLLPGKSHGRRSLVGCSPWGHEELDTTERLPFHFLLSCIGEGNGNPLQSFCLENPRDGGAWWAAVYGVAQSRTRLKRLSSSSSEFYLLVNFLSIPPYHLTGSYLELAIPNTFRDITLKPFRKMPIKEMSQKRSQLEMEGILKQEYLERV